MLKLLQIIIHVLNCSLSMVPELCHNVKIHPAIDKPQGFSNGSTLARRIDGRSGHEKWDNHTPECIHLLTPRLPHLALWLVELREGRIWRHHRPELVEFVDPGMSFEEGHYPVHLMLEHTGMDGMKDIGYDHIVRSDAFHIPDDAF